MLLEINNLFEELEKRKVHIDAAVKIIIKGELRDYFDKIKPREQVSRKLREFKVPKEAVDYILTEMDNFSGVK